MYRKYYLRYKNTVIGVFLTNKYMKRYVPSHVSVDTHIKYPLGLFPIKAIKNGVIEPDTEYCPEDDDIYNWIEDRVFPKDRDGAINILNTHGLSSYNAWEIAVLTRAASLMDDYWFSASLADKYEDFHPRSETSNRTLVVVKPIWKNGNLVKSHIRSSFVPARKNVENLKHEADGKISSTGRKFPASKVFLAKIKIQEGEKY